ncbi:hypothetical protein MKZ26_16435 [Sporosarcina sp. FSL K6-6792]|uniref:hypothetical protein n=1 Tax=Sporosarcina sp. FSL K6-6792 TaxID=2921559 RepID=UPI0030FB4406
MDVHTDVAKQIDGIRKEPLASALNAAGYKYSSATPRGGPSLATAMNHLIKAFSTL